MRAFVPFALLAMSCANGVADDGATSRDAGRDVVHNESGMEICDPAEDPCPPDLHCDSMLRACVDGCRSDEGCPGKKCDVAKHACVSCFANSDCGPGKACSGGDCVPACSATMACPGALSCCSSACVDQQSDVGNCGGCGTACSVAHGKPSCTAGSCGIASCDATFADCDHQTATGCETDTASSLDHCGACGKACAPANASGACTAGTCAIASCKSGFADCDKKVETGCEADLAHDPKNCGACGVAPTESCNLKDDDCNGKCDDVDGCRVAVHRASNAVEHFYTTSASEAACCGYTVEFSPYFYLYAASAPGTVPFNRCYAKGHHFYTTAADCELLGASSLEGPLGFIATAETCGATALYRLFKNDDHLYTIDTTERASAIASGWLDEGIVGWVWRGPRG